MAAAAGCAGRAPDEVDERVKGAAESRMARVASGCALGRVRAGDPRTRGKRWPRGSGRGRGGEGVGRVSPPRRIGLVRGVISGVRLRPRA